MERGLRGGWRDDDRVLQFEVEHLRREIYRRGVHGPAWHQIDPIERLSIASQCKFTAITMRGVIVGGLWNVREHHRLEIERAEHLHQPRRASMERQWAGIELRVQQRRSGHDRAEPRQRLAPRHAARPLGFNAHTTSWRYFRAEQNHVQRRDAESQSFFSRRKILCVFASPRRV